MEDNSCIRCGKELTGKKIVCKACSKRNNDSEIAVVIVLMITTLIAVTWTMFVL